MEHRKVRKSLLNRKDAEWNMCMNCVEGIQRLQEETREFEQRERERLRNGSNTAPLESRVSNAPLESKKEEQQSKSKPVQMYSAARSYRSMPRNTYIRNSGYNE